MRKAFLRSAVLVCALLLVCAPVSAADSAPPSESPRPVWTEVRTDIPAPKVAAEWLAHFPWSAGEKRLYIVYYGSRKHSKRHLSGTCLWEEAVEAASIHGFRTVVIRSSEGSMSKEQGQWVYGDPERIVEERVYVITSHGVDLSGVYTVRNGDDAAYRRQRKAFLARMRARTRDDFVSGLENWVLLFPVRAGLRRRWPAEDGLSYKVLRRASKAFVTPAFREKAAGVAAYSTFGWSWTRWYVPFEGLVSFETQHMDKGVDRKRYPFRVKALAVYK